MTCNGTATVTMSTIYIRYVERLEETIAWNDENVITTKRR